MRFAFVVNNYPPRVGGLESHVHSLVRHLSGSGHEVLVITLSDAPSAHSEDGVRVVRLAEHSRVGEVLGFPGWGATRRIEQLLVEHETEVISVHTRFFPLTWIGARIGKRRGMAVIHTEHGSGYVVSESAIIRLASRMVDHTFGWLALRRADTVLGVSENVVDFVSALSGRKATVFYNAIEAPQAPLSHAEAGDALRLVFVGRLVSGKGADDFVDMASILVSGGRQVHAEILGDGAEREAIEERIAALGLQDHVVMRGRVPSAEVRDALRGAVLVNPTTLAEGFQTTLLEALAEGGRVVTYAVPGATKLREQGHPVVIAAGRGAGVLVEALDEVDEQADAAADMREWFWPERAEQYVRISEATIEDVRRRR